MKAALFIVLMLIGAVSQAQETLPARPEIPEFPTESVWINTPRPLTLHGDLKGHVVLLDFWTYCCINCLHILPDLEDLETRFRDVPFVVVGVHSAKFDNENVPENVRAAVRRHHISHPVVVDTKQDLWQRLGVRAWPTLILIDTEGRGFRAWSGEGNKESIAEAITKLVAEGRARGTLADKAWKSESLPPLETATGLSFPGKVIGSPTSDRIFVADSSANRIIEATWPNKEGRSKLVRIFGTGSPGYADGDQLRAQFRFPQGLAQVGNDLWVADTDNHAVRHIDLASGVVSTLVGNGTMGNDRSGGKRGREQSLNSPWDLAASPGSLAVAMAGTHQLWKVDTTNALARRFSGSGRENIKDGAPDVANFAQPSGLAWLGVDLLVADSETSSIRRVSPDGRASTLVGEGLFEFGDTDGPLGSARLQHALGVAVLGKSIIIADTYNSKLKLIDTGLTRVDTLPLTFASEPKSLAEPGGVSSAGDRWLVADTNHHRILQVFEDGRAIEVQIAGIRKQDSRPAPAPESRPR